MTVRINTVKIHAFLLAVAVMLFTVPVPAEEQPQGTDQVFTKVQTQSSGCALPMGWKPARYDFSRKATGTIIILTGHNINREPLPVVVSDQNSAQVVYSFKVVDPDVFRNNGIVRYAFSLEEAAELKIAGDNPLIVTAVGVGSDNQIIIHQNDAVALRETLDNGNDYLKNARVVVVN